VEGVSVEGVSVDGKVFLPRRMRMVSHPSLADAQAVTTTTHMRPQLQQCRHPHRPCTIHLPVFSPNQWHAGVSKELIDRIPGRQTDRKTPLGELNWIFTAITDTIAWNSLPRALFQKLFRQVRGRGRGREEGAVSPCDGARETTCKRGNLTQSSSCPEGGV
jgi:hypothetical protein